MEFRYQRRIMYLDGSQKPYYVVQVLKPYGFMTKDGPFEERMAWDDATDNDIEELMKEKK
jgi:hypothetical protein